MTNRLIATKASSSRPRSPGTSLRSEEDRLVGAGSAELKPAGFALNDMFARLLQNSALAEIARRSTVQRHRQTDRRLPQLDFLGCRVRLNKLIQPVEQQFRHQVSDIVADPLAGHKEIRNRCGRDLSGLA